jgi:uncharacterized protein
MKKLILACFLLLNLGLSAQPVTSTTEDLPHKSNTLVTDYTNALSAKEKGLLERKLVGFNDLTGSQVAVVIMESTGKYDVKAYGLRLANSWGIGQKGKNNGVLVLIAVNDRKMAILTGKGLQSIVTDAICGEIIQNNFVPHFKNGDYYRGIDEGTNRLMKYVKGN